MPPLDALEPKSISQWYDSMAKLGFPDTGYDMINLDPGIVARYYQDIPGANSVTVPGQYTFPCNSSMPDLRLSIDGAGVTIRGHVLNYHPYDADPNSKHLTSTIMPFRPSYSAALDICGIVRELTDNAVCVGTLQNAGTGSGALFGQAFMMAQFMVFNFGDKTVSFAEIAPDCC